VNGKGLGESCPPPRRADMPKWMSAMSSTSLHSSYILQMKWKVAKVWRVCYNTLQVSPSDV